MWPAAHLPRAHPLPSEPLVCAGCARCTLWPCGLERALWPAMRDLSQIHTLAAGLSSTQSPFENPFFP